MTLTDASVSCGPETTGVESGAADAFAAKGTGAEPDSAIAVTLPSERSAAFASTSARFRRAVSYPDRLLVGCRAGDIQPDRVTFEYRVVSTRLNAVACEGQAVVVSYDYRAGAKAPIPEAIRKAIDVLESQTRTG